MGTLSRFAFVVALMLGLSSAASASLTITNADIVAGHYVYDLTYNETFDSTVLNQDTLSVTNLTGYVWAPVHMVAAVYTYSASAGLTYKFDFSGTAYRPTALNLRERVTLFNNVHGHDLTLAVSGWSTDNATWNPITSLLTPQQEVVGDIVTNYATTISGMPDAIYYQISMTTQPGDRDGVLTADQNQWNRLEPDNGNFFLVDFTMKELGPTTIPEPAGLGLVGAAFLALRKRRS